MVPEPKMQAVTMEEDPPLVSTILIFLNARRFMREAVESVLAQTYENWELLLVDDGSTDGSTEIALNYAERFPKRIRHLQHSDGRNRGASASRNLGIDRAQGEFIAFLDSDDVWLPQKLERQVALMRRYPKAGMIYGQPHYWYDWTEGENPVVRDPVPLPPVELDTLVEPPTLLLRSHPLGRHSAPCPSDIMVRREAVERVGGFEESFTGPYQLYEDQTFLAKVYLAEPVFVSSECWDYYRRHVDSCMSVTIESGNYHAVRAHFMNWLAMYLSGRGITDPEVWRALSRASLRYRRPLLYRTMRWVRSLFRREQ